MVPPAQSPYYLDLQTAIARDPIVVSPNMTVTAAIAQLCELREPQNIADADPGQPQTRDIEARSGCVVVVENNHVVGVLTESTIVRLVAQQKPLEQLFVRQVMTHPVITLYESTLTDITDLAHLLQQQSHPLPIVDAHDRLIGIVTQTSLLHTLHPLEWYKTALQMSEDRWQLALEGTKDGIWDWDLIANRVFYSNRWKTMRGFTDDEVGNYPEKWSQGIHPEDYERVMAGVADHLAGKSEFFEMEYRVQRKDRSYIWILDRGQVLRNEAGQAIRMSGSEMDISDRKQAEQTIRQQVDREKLLREITQRIRQSLDLQTIFNTACEEIRRVLQADRVGIFKFYPGCNFSDGEFVAESVVQDFKPILQLHVHDHCFGEKYASHYAQGRFYAVDDIYANGLSHCHTNFLAQLQIRANLVIPILYGQQLWGLLCVHQCTTHRQWQQSEIEVTQQLANQLALAIQQANLYEQIQSELLVRQQAEARMILQLQRQEVLGTIIQQIRESLDINKILTTVTQQVKDVLHSDRAIVFRLFADGRSQIVEEAVSSQFTILKSRHWQDEQWSQSILDCYWQGTPRIVPDVMDDIWTSCLKAYSIEGQIQSKIVAPILLEIPKGEQHRWIAPWGTKQLWGILVVHACAEKRLWRASEAELLQQIANQLAIAIQQSNLFDQLQKELTERQQAQQQLTERNQQLALANEELVRATRLKDEFLANMSHELRTPLNAILGMTEGLQDHVFGNVTPQQIKALQTIERSGSHLLELINDILDVAKIEAGQIDLNYSPTSVVSLCQSSLAFIKQQALQKRIQLQIDLPPVLPDLLVDERRIRQVLINLLNNAVKFTPEGGQITLRVRHFNAEHAAQTPQYQTDSSRQDQQTGLVQRLTLNSQHPPSLGQEFTPEYLQIAVIDTGIGIAPENMDKLFQPFIQIDSALNRQYQGTGLGLVLVKRLVELHGGQVGLTSAVGVGSCFTVNLPCTISASFSHQNSSLHQRQHHAEFFPPTDVPLILLAEDNEANIMTISSYLQARGYRVGLARTGQEAILQVQSIKPDLILMDVQMPGLDGLEVIKQIRHDLNLINLPIIALTALAMPSDRDRCFEAGASDYLSKPIKLKQLVDMIQQWLDDDKQGC